MPALSEKLEIIVQAEDWPEAVRKLESVGIDKKHRKAYMIGIVQSFSQVWGGGHFIIIPTDGKIIDDIF